MDTEKKQDQTSKEELAAYEKLLHKVGKSFGELNEKLSRETISQAIDRAASELKEIGGHSKEAIGKASAALKKDIASTTEHVKPKVDEAAETARNHFDDWLDKGGALWHNISQEAERLYEFSRDKSGAFLVRVALSLSDWSQNLGEKVDSSLKYKTGEITHGGEFVCSSCNGKIHLKQPGRIPPCPKCTKTEFRRS